MYSRDSLDFIKQTVDPKEVLISIGGISPSSISELGDEIRCPCPLHGGDNKTSFSWKRSTGSWTCFSHGCGKEQSHYLFGFVSQKLGINFTQAAEHLSRHFGIPLTEDGGFVKKDTLLTREYIKEQAHAEKYKVENLKSYNWLPGYYEEGFNDMLEYLASRGYNYDEVKGFDVYPQLDFLGTLRVGIPVYDEENRLVGVNGRLLDTIFDYPDKIEKEGKVYPVPKYRMSKFQKGSVVYNLNIAQQYSLKQGLVVVEGQLDVVRLNCYGIKNAICTMGTTLSPQQISLLYKHAYHLKFLVEEGDAAWKGVKSSIRQLKGGMKVSVAFLESGDADSNSKEVVLECLTNAKQLTTQELNNIDSYERQ